MTKRYSIAEARQDFAAVVKQAEEEAVIQITRRGRTVAVLMSLQEYESLSSGRVNFWQAYSDFRSRVDLAALEIEPSLFDGLREDSPGRLADL